jgi:hypothetical protein
LVEQRGFRAVALVARGTRQLRDADGLHARSLATGSTAAPPPFARSTTGNALRANVIAHPESQSTVPGQPLPCRRGRPVR